MKEETKLLMLMREWEMLREGGCLLCKHNDKEEWEMPCASCRRSHKDYWERKETNV